MELVILESPYHTLSQSQEARDLFIDNMIMRMENFKDSMGYGALPNGELDYLGTHVHACIRNNGKLIPIMSYKFISKKICDDFRIEYPILKWLRDEQNDPDVLDRFMWQMNATPAEEFFYMGSLALNPEFKKDVRVAIKARNLLFDSFDSVMKTYNVKKNYIVALESSRPMAMRIGYEKFHDSTVAVDSVKGARGTLVQWANDNEAIKQLNAHIITSQPIQGDDLRAA